MRGIFGITESLSLILAFFFLIFKKFFEKQKKKKSNVDKILKFLKNLFHSRRNVNESTYSSSTCKILEFDLELIVSSSSLNSLLSRV